ncbi:vomeronasal type-1 receptor 4 [Fukomys damarensis]|nr:vomeronasal type-1 receptor 4 [Fukomys damarensis]
MTASEVVMGVIFLSQIVLGVLGNCSLLYRYLFLHFTGCRLRSTDLILKHLIVANLVTLLCRGVPETMAAFSWQVCLSHAGCKLLFYLHRLSRGASMGSTCLLSVSWAITISPRDSRPAELKVKAAKYVGSSLCLIWVLCGLVNVIFLTHMTGKWSKKNHTSLKDFGYCTSVRQDKTTESLYTVLLSVPEVSCLGLMLWTSSSMVSVLYRHRQQMRHIHRTNVTPRSSPESRATKTILLLVSTYICFYALSCIFQVWLSLTYNPHWLLLNTSAIVAGLFPAVSPFLLLSRDSSVSRLSVAFIRNRKAPAHVTNG